MSQTPTKVSLALLDAEQLTIAVDGVAFATVTKIAAFAAIVLTLLLPCSAEAVAFFYLLFGPVGATFLAQFAPALD